MYKFATQSILVLCFLTFFIGASGQSVGIQTETPDSTLSIANKVEIGASQGDIVLTDDMASLTFPATEEPNTPMIYMFSDGFNNDNRMLFGHSPDYPNFGIQYRDTSEEFHFLGAGNHAFSLSIASSNRGNAALGDAAIDEDFLFNMETNSDRRVLNIHNKTNTSSVTHAVYARHDGAGSGPKRAGLFGVSGGTGTNIGVMATASGSTEENIAVYGYAIGANARSAYFDQGDVQIDDVLMIGTDQKASGYKLNVNGKIIGEELRIQEIEEWPDYVFEPEYELMPLDILEDEISKLGHLPAIPSAEVIESEGLDSGSMHKMTMRKVEELTLYLIELNKQNQALQNTVNDLSDQVTDLKKQLNHKRQ